MTYDATRFRAYFEHEFSYDAGFRRNVSRFGSQVAIVDPPSGKSWTYAQLGAAVDSAARALAGHLRRVAPALRKNGVNVEFTRGKERLIKLTR